MSPKGKEQVGMIVSAEKGNKAVACISVHGVYVPPMLRLFHGAQLRSIGFCSPSGSINTELFVKWLQPFLSLTAKHRLRETIY